MEHPKPAHQQLIPHNIKQMPPKPTLATNNLIVPQFTLANLTLDTTTVDTHLDIINDAINIELKATIHLCKATTRRLSPIISPSRTRTCRPMSTRKYISGATNTYLR